MKFKIKHLVLLIIYPVFVNTSLGQGAKDRFFTDYYFTTIFLDYYTSPIILYSIEESSGLVEYDYQEDGISLFSFGGRFRYNLFDIKDNAAFSVQTDPSFGLGASGSGLSIPFNMPCLLSLNFGAGSTYKDDSKIGFMLGAGMEYNFHLVDLTESMEGNFPSQISWLEPAASIGLRWWNKKYKLKEVNVKYGYKKIDKHVDPNDPDFFSDAHTFRITYHTFLNY